MGNYNIHVTFMLLLVGVRWDPSSVRSRAEWKRAIARLAEIASIHIRAIITVLIVLTYWTRTHFSMSPALPEHVPLRNPFDTRRSISCILMVDAIEKVSARVPCETVSDE